MHLRVNCTYRTSLVSLDVFAHFCLEARAEIDDSDRLTALLRKFYADAVSMTMYSCFYELTDFEN